MGMSTGPGSGLPVATTAQVRERARALARDESTRNRRREGVSYPAMLTTLGACMTAAAQLRESGFIGVDDTVVVLNTGTGFKYPETISVDVPVLPVDGVIPTSPTR